MGALGSRLVLTQVASYSPCATLGTSGAGRHSVISLLQDHGPQRSANATGRGGPIMHSSGRYERLITNRQARKGSLMILLHVTRPLIAPKRAEFPSAFQYSGRCPRLAEKRVPAPLPWVSSCGGAGQSPARVHLRHAGFLSGYKSTLHHHVKGPINDRPDHRAGSLLGRAGKLLVHYANQGRDGGKLFVLRICSEKGFRMMYENIDHC